MTVEEMIKVIYVCKHCGSDEVIVCKWVNYNTFLEWCMDCKCETKIISEDRFNFLSNLAELRLKLE